MHLDNAFQKYVFRDHKNQYAETTIPEKGENTVSTFQIQTVDVDP